MNPIVTMMTFREQLFIHLMIGVALVLVAAIRANRRGNKPPRWFFDFGSGMFGEQKRWIQWYGWALIMEMITSIFYVHTGMFYYEIGMSVIEAIALTIGAFIVDRVADLLAGNVEIVPSTNTESIKNIGAKVYDFSSRASESVKSKMKTPTLDDEVLKKENKTFEDITRGH